MNKKKFKELKQLNENVMNASTKNEAKNSLTLLKFMVSSLNGEISPNQYIKLSEAISFSKEASGQVQDKDRCLSNAKQTWSAFERLIKNEIKD